MLSDQESKIVKQKTTVRDEDNFYAFFWFLFCYHASSCSIFWFPFHYYASLAMYLCSCALDIVFLFLRHRASPQHTRTHILRCCSVPAES